MKRLTVRITDAEKFTRLVFGSIMMLSYFVSFGKELTFVLGASLVISAVTGLCVTCKLYDLLVRRRQTLPHTKLIWSSLFRAMKRRQAKLGV